MNKPAMTPDEWANYKDIVRPRMRKDSLFGPIPQTLTLSIDPPHFVDVSDGEYTIRIEEDEDLHGTAAACLFRQPFGFTHDDVGHLRLVAGQCDALRLGTNHSAVLRNLADRIEALLPPREEAE